MSATIYDSREPAIPYDPNNPADESAFLRVTIQSLTETMDDLLGRLRALGPSEAELSRRLAAAEYARDALRARLTQLEILEATAQTVPCDAPG